MNPLSNSPYCLIEGATIHDALTLITENKCGVAVVVSAQGVLLGVLSDGDIRRAMVKGATALTPVVKILNSNVLSVRQSATAQDESLAIFKEHAGINIVPVLGSGNKVVDVVVRT